MNDEAMSQLFVFENINAEQWTLLNAGFGAFLYISEAKSHDPFNQITNEV